MDVIIEKFGIDPALIAAETVNFLIVVGILYYFVFRKVGAMLDERKKVIEDGVANAEQAESKLTEAEAEKQTILHAAGEEATAEIKAAVETAKLREAQIVGDANTQATTIIENANHKGEEMKQKIVESSKEDIAKMIVLGAEKTLAAK